MVCVFGPDDNEIRFEDLEGENEDPKPRKRPRSKKNIAKNTGDVFNIIARKIKAEPKFLEWSTRFTLLPCDSLSQKLAMGVETRVWVSYN